MPRSRDQSVDNHKRYARRDFFQVLSISEQATLFGVMILQNTTAATNWAVIMFGIRKPRNDAIAVKGVGAGWPLVSSCSGNGAAVLLGPSNSIAEPKRFQANTASFFVLFRGMIARRGSIIPCTRIRVRIRH